MEYLDFYEAKLNGDEDTFLAHYGADVASQLSGILTNVRSQKTNALKTLDQAINQLDKAKTDLNTQLKKKHSFKIDGRKVSGNIRQLLQFSSKVVFANKSKARRKIEQLISPEKAKEAKRMRFAFPLAIGIARGLGGSRFKNLRPAIKDSFDLSFDMLGYVTGARSSILRPTITILKTIRKTLRQLKVPNTITNKKQLDDLISSYEKAIKVVDSQIGQMQKILGKVKSSYVPKLSSSIQRLNSIMSKISSPIEFIVKTLQEAPKSRAEVRAQRKKKKGKKSTFRQHRDKRKILNKIRPSKRKQRAKQVLSFYRPHKKFAISSLESARTVRNDLPGQINQALNQMQQVRQALKQMVSTLRQAKSMMPSGGKNLFGAETKKNPFTDPMFAIISLGALGVLAVTVTSSRE